MSKHRCPVCGAASASPELCNGSFLDRDHPLNVPMEPVLTDPDEPATPAETEPKAKSVTQNDEFGGH